MLAYAQSKDNDGHLNPASVPLSSQRLRDFVPADWKIEEELTEDLNGDQRPDRILVLIDARVGQEEFAYDERALLVLLAQAGGGWRRIGLGNKLLLCQSCYGLNFQGPAAAPGIGVKKGILVIEQHFGGSMTQYVTHRLRYEATTKRMRLIGIDSRSFDRSTGDAVDESTNYLTGKYSSSKTHVNINQNEGEEEEEDDLSTVTCLVLKKTYLEETDISDFR